MYQRAMPSGTWQTVVFGGGGGRGLTHVMEDQQQDHGENRLLLGCLETLDLLLGEQGSQNAESSHSVAQCISLSCLSHISLGGPQVAGDQAEYSVQDTHMLVHKRQEIATEEVLGAVDNNCQTRSQFLIN